MMMGTSLRCFWSWLDGFFALLKACMDGIWPPHRGYLGFSRSAKRSRYSNWLRTAEFFDEQPLTFMHHGHSVCVGQKASTRCFPYGFDLIMGIFISVCFIRYAHDHCARHDLDAARPLLMAPTRWLVSVCFVAY